MHANKDFQQMVVTNVQKILQTVHLVNIMTIVSPYQLAWLALKRRQTANSVILALVFAMSVRQIILLIVILDVCQIVRLASSTINLFHLPNV